MRIISIINQKGGCGKTTSAINLAGISARKGYRTLLVDLDPQSHCAAGLAIPEQRIDLDIGDAMLAPQDQAIDPARLFWRASRNLDLAPSRMRLAGLESNRGGLADKPDKERRLANLLSRFARNYDICFIDCSPSIGLLTYNALAAATDVLIPVETSFFALQGATKQVNTIKSLSKRLGSAAPYWLVATIHDETSVLACDLLEELRRRFGKRVVPHVIRRDITLKEAASFGQPIVEYSPASVGAKDYTILADWLIETITMGQDARAASIDTPGDDGGRGEPPAVEVVGAMEAKLGLGRKLAGPVEESSSLPETPARPIGDSPVQSPTPDPLPARVTSGSISSGGDPSPIGPLNAAVQTLTSTAIAEPISTPREVIVAFEHETTEAAAINRAEDLAQRARVMLLKRADERLRRMLDSGPAASLLSTSGSTEPAPIIADGGTIGEVKPLTLIEPPGSPPNPKVRQFFGARQTRSGVLFVQPISTGIRVAIAGDFNDWSATSWVMKRNDELGVFELCRPVPPGRYRYRLVIDGRWAADPFCNLCEPNEFNELNSVLEVEQP